MINVSVLMCVYNEDERVLRKAIQSIVKQSLKSFEFIIILDNPKNMNLYEVINEYALGDSRIRLYVNQSNMGLISSLNKGLNLARGEYIARMDADDISSKNRLLLQKRILDDHPDISLVTGNYVFINEQDKVIGRNVSLSSVNGQIKKAMMYANVIAHPCVMFRKRDVLLLQGYRNIYSAEDFDLWMRMILSNKNIWIIDRCLLKYRIRKDSISSSSKMLQRYTTQAIRKYNKHNKVITIDELDQYIIKHVNPQKEKRFVISHRLYLNAWEKIRSRELIKAFCLLLVSGIIHFDSFIEFYEIMRFGKILKKNDYGMARTDGRVRRL